MRPWSREQARYREILIQIRQRLSGSDQIGRPFLKVYGIIRTLRHTSPAHFDREAIRKTREDARTLLEAIDELQLKLRSGGLSPELRLRLGLDAFVIRSSADLATMPVPRLIEALNAVRDLCQAGADNQPSTDQVKIWCARIAFTLLQLLDRESSSGSADSPYRVIAGLLYEILTGEQGRDLKRACDDYLSSIRSMQRAAASTKID